MAKKKYYDLQPLLNTGCCWKILYGMRANGKSYSVKKHCIEDAMKGRYFVYLRRWSEDIKTKDVSSYFDDMPFNELTNGKYQGIMAWQGFFYFYTVGEDDDKPKKGPLAGRYCALNLYERYKSQVFKDYDNIIFEEFLTRRTYLGNGFGVGAEHSEPKLLMSFVSTVARDRDVNVFMIANTETRVNPYEAEWGLHMSKQKPGTIDIYHLHGENGVVDIAVENCEVVQTKSKMFFGLAAKQITKGEWDVDDVPKLLKPYEFYDMLYEIKAIYDNFKFCIQLMVDPENGSPFVFIYPLTKENRKIDRIVTNEFRTDWMVSNGLDHRIRAECIMADCFKRGKVCFSDNLTGTDFKQITKYYDFKGVI